MMEKGAICANIFIYLSVTVSQEAYSMNKYGVGILAAVMIAALVMPAVAAGQATTDQVYFGPRYMTISGYVHEYNSGAAIPDATVIMVFYGNSYEYTPASIGLDGIQIVNTTTDANGYYYFGYDEWQGWNWDIYAYPFSPALVFSYALGFEPSDPQIIFLAENYYFNIIMTNLTYIV